MDGSEASTVTMEMSRPSGPAFDTLSSHTDEHCSWDRQVEYILACCGFVTNIGCYLQFPQFSVQHGGGVFFMMYLVLVLTCGFPMMYMEMVLGQYARGGPIVAWHVIPWFKGFGVSLVIVSFTIALYSNITIAWTLYHFVISLGSSTLPWIYTKFMVFVFPGFGVSLVIVSFTIALYSNITIAWTLYHFVISLGSSTLRWIYTKFMVFVFTGFGVSLVIVSFTIALYSNITIAWTLYHFVISLRSTLPWIYTKYIVFVLTGFGVSLVIVSFTIALYSNITIAWTLYHFVISLGSSTLPWIYTKFMVFVFPGFGVSLVIVSFTIALYSNITIAWTLYHFVISLGSSTLPWIYTNFMVFVFTGFGVSLVIVSFTIALYSNITIAWTLYHFVISLGSSTLPWIYTKFMVFVFPGFGVSLVIVSFTIALYSNITIAWTLYHFVISMGSTVPWICLDNHGIFISSTGLRPVELMRSPFVRHPSVCPSLVYMTFCGSHVLILALLVRSCMEDGAISGVKFFLSMKWSALGNLQAWVDAGRLMFTSLGLGTGCLTSLAGYTHFHSHCFRNSLITIIVHCLEMVLAGFITFACLGVHCETLGTQISNLNITSLDLGFSLVPRVLGTMTDKPSVWCGLFFFMMLLLQLDTQSVYVQNVVSAVLHLLKDKWRFRWKFKLSALVTMCLIVLLMGLIFTTQGGIFIYHYLQFSVSRLCLFVLVLFECCALAWVYGAQRLWNNVADMTGTTDSPWWKLTWRFISPVSILALIILCFLTIQPLEYHTYTYPQWTEYLGWGITLLPTLPLITFLVILLVGEDGTLKLRVRRLTRTPRDWGPGPLLNQEPSNDLPDYVICTPDIYKPENALAILTANLYIPNLTNLISVQDADEGEMTNGYLSDLQTVVSSEDSDEESGRGNWSSRLDFVLSCLGYVVGLGNVWRFPYLVFRNGGGAFFIPYLIMLVFVGVPVVYMELAFGQYASLGPVTVWRSVPLFKGIGISMVLATTLISIYYNVVNAWAFHYLFSSMVADLPWLHCRNSWNTQSCSKNMYQFANCSLLNVSMIEHRDLVNDTCTDVLRNCTAFPEQDFDRVGTCITKLRELVGSAAFINNSHINSQKLTSPTEEYFYNKVLDRSGSIGHLGSVQWELALCLLLCWVIVFICLVRGIKTSGKVAYFVVTFPFVIIVVLLVRALTLEGNMQGIRFYVSPKWEKLKEGGVWADAAVQVFFSLSACMGGLVTLASYNKFHNNIYSDAVLICLGDTLMSVLAGFAIFATMGVLSHKLNTDIEDVFKSDIGLTFIVSPAAMSYFPVSPLWSILFFVMIVMLGLSTQFVNIETVITAIIDENIAILRKRRLLVLFVVCMSLFLLGLPLTTQGGIYVLTLMDEYLAGVPIMVNGLFLCVAIGWVYGITKFSTDIKHMIGHTVSYWWKTLWCAISPLIILFILIFSMVGYESLTYKHGDEIYESWSEVLGFILLCIPVISIPSWAVYKLVTTRGSLKQRIKQLCRSENNWGPALEHNWKNVEYYPAVNTNTLSVDIEHSPLHTVTGKEFPVCTVTGKESPLHPVTGRKSPLHTVTGRKSPLHTVTLKKSPLHTVTGKESPLHTVTDHVDFTTSGMKVPSLSSQASLLPQPLSPKKPRDMRERAILNHAYSNPQFNHSSGELSFCLPKFINF
ncbi:hypothetical protein FSP39_002321 [Pinctada imbricata]|uniref:Transporter n=1 Tax=Pinctada imbricata TaxID=66713 RepID=A0AA88YDC4_PINIB|nr:hypothetical protein FSP39_002321 [Pinctada imbricata]